MPRPPKLAAPPKRGEGQWALGYREPLNANEQAKKDDDALNVRARIENIYAHGGFASIDPSDLRNRFRWWGLYTQRKPGIDGGRTAVLEPHELDDEYFMLRVRIDGGQLTTEQLRTIADISTTYARDSADVTDRQNIQLHWIRVEDVPEIWDRLEAVGLSRRRPAVTPPRRARQPACRHRGGRADRPDPGGRRDHRPLHRDTEFSNLPRKFKTAITGHPGLDVAPEVNDLAFVPTVHPEHGVGFDVWVGGGLSTNPHARQDASASGCRSTRCADVWARRDQRLPRLRVSATAGAGAAEVPRRRLGRREVPRGARGRVPRTGRWSTASPRPSHSATATTSACTSRRTAATTSASPRSPVASQRHDARQARRHRRGARLDPGPHHAVPEAGRPRRRAGRRRLAGRGGRGPRTLRPAQPVAALDHGMHRHRVLQARDRRDQGPCCRPRRRARAAHPGARHPDHGAPQRLPQLLRPHPGRRHRAQGPARPRRARQPRRGVPGPPRRGSGSRGRLRPQAARSQGDDAPGSPTTSSGIVRTYLAEREDGERFASWARAPTRRSCDERPHRPPALPLLRGREPAPARRHARRLGVPRVPARLRRQVPRPASPAGTPAAPTTSSLSTDEPRSAR